jgi:hypothetical protein
VDDRRGVFGVDHGLAVRGEDVVLRSVWKIPSPGFTDPTSVKTYKESASDFTTQIGTAYLCGYGFNEQ